MKYQGRVWGQVLFRAPPDFAILDEAQDISVSALRFFAAMGGNRPNALFFAGDLGQRIFQQPFSWKSLGVDIRGRSRTLRINYRTSHQIRQQADRLLGPAVSDIDGNTEDRSDTISVFNGPPPVIRTFATEAEEAEAVSAWLTEQSVAGVLPHEFGVFVRSEGQLDRAIAAVKAARSREVKDEIDSLASEYDTLSAEIVQAVAPLREEHCRRHGYTSSVRVPDNLGLSIGLSWSDKYSKISGSVEPAIRDIIGDTFDQFFTTSMTITVKDMSEESLKTIVRAIGPERFAEFF